jgi:hypothetical protein
MSNKNDEVNVQKDIEQQRRKATNDGYSLKDIFVEMELELVASLKRNLKRHLKEEIKEGFAWEQWQKASLRDINRFRKENKAIIGSYSKEIEDTINEVLSTTYDNQLIRKDDAGFSLSPTGTELKELEKSPISMPISDKKMLPGTTPPLEKSFFGVNDRKMKVLITEMESSFKEAQGAVFRKAEDVYRKTIFNASIQLNAGAITLPKAIDLAVKNFLKQGINCIQYSDGRMVNIATYAEMALRTASQRAKFLADGSKRAEQGVYTILVSTHNTSCDKCLKWQGQILIDDVFSDLSTDKANELAKETGYALLSTAVADGLLHPNCRHLLTTYYPGISRKPPTTDEKLALKNYHAEQRQRMLENRIRQAKREVHGYVDEVNVSDAKNELRSLQKELREHLKDNPQLRRASHREKIYLEEVKT